MSRGRIPSQTVQEIKRRASILTVVSEYISLKRQGVGSYSGLCPFHDENTPSFHVRDSLGLYHCFGCGEGGDVIKFIQSIEGLSFLDAVEHLARLIGMEIQYEKEDEAQRNNRSRLLTACRLAGEFYREQLSGEAAAPARSFLLQRGFDEAVWAEYELGFAPVAWDKLTGYLRGRGFSVDELEQAGLLLKASSVRDRFRARLLWPIKDITGSTVGFGARKIMEDDSGPKYINSPESTIYQKSYLLYGLSLAKKSIAKSGRVVVVEGYTDVMACHQSGVSEAVATCGTAWGNGHMQLVKRVLPQNDGKIVFAFDGDQAGQNAVVRAFREHPQMSTRAYAAITKSGLDPCELRLVKGPEAVQDLIGNPLPVYEFVLDYQLSQNPIDTYPQRREGLMRVLPVLKEIPDAALRLHYAGRVGMRLGIPKEEIEALLPPGVDEIGRVPAKGWKRPADVRLDSNPEDARLTLEKSVIKAFLQYPHLIERELIIELCDYEFHNPTLAYIAQMIGMVSRQNEGELSAAEFNRQLLEILPPEYHSLIHSLEVSAPPVRSEDELSLHLEGLVKRFENQHLLAQKAALFRELEVLKSSYPSEEKTALLAKYSADDEEEGIAVLHQLIAEKEEYRRTLLPE